MDQCETWNAAIVGKESTRDNELALFGSAAQNQQEPIRSKDIGGSNAQRDVLDIFLIDCAIASGDAALSRRLLHEYLDLRPSSVPMQARLSDLEAA